MKNVDHYKNLSIIDAEGEIWVDINGYKGQYQVSNMGRVKSLTRIIRHPKKDVDKVLKSKIMKQYISIKGYCNVVLCKIGIKKRYSVHQLVGLNWIPNPENKKGINHKKGIKTDNRVTEIEWSTHDENMKHAGEFGLMPKGEKHFRFGKIYRRGRESANAVPVIQYSLDGDFIKIWECMQDAAKGTGVKVGSISAACIGKIANRGGNYIWKYYKGEVEKKIPKYIDKGI